ncbi:hypothetical protein F2Q68_00017679 [Brassica cretica]|uniref:Uncharacterized protein n=1 Tax=Brassica cretica TaxID=69181 RepID=A0A8S9HPP9_BRACR|nr:hypothetical protein F2Q68_00017679 [Brassica cretica]
MASASSSAARLLIRGRAANLTENTGSAIRSLLLLNQTVVPSQYPVFSETFPVMQPGLGSCFIQEEAVSERRGKMEAAAAADIVELSTSFKSIVLGWL